jgi:hypothetical protein
VKDQGTLSRGNMISGKCLWLGPFQVRLRPGRLHVSHAMRAFLRCGAAKVDVGLRALDVVEHWTRRAVPAEFEIDQMEARRLARDLPKQRLDAGKACGLDQPLSIVVQDRADRALLGKQRVTAVAE